MRPTMFHGQGVRGDYDKTLLPEYCRLVDDQVTATLRGQEAPLLLAATEPLETIYRRNTRYTRLSDHVIAGNPDAADAADLHRRAVELMADEFLRPIRTARRRYHQALSAHLACDGIEAVLRAARAHAVDVLLVSSERRLWGRFDDQGTFEQRDDRQAGDEDLLNLAAVLACRGGADVYAVGQEDLPVDSPAAAILRFRLGE